MFIIDQKRKNEPIHVPHARDTLQRLVTQEVYFNVLSFFFRAMLGDGDGKPVYVCVYIYTERKKERKTAKWKKNKNNNNNNNKIG